MICTVIGAVRGDIDPNKNKGVIVMKTRELKRCEFRNKRPRLAERCAGGGEKEGQTINAPLTEDKKKILLARIGCCECPVIADPGFATAGQARKYIDGCNARIFMHSRGVEPTCDRMPASAFVSRAKIAYRELKRRELPEPIRSVDGGIRWFVVTGHTPLGPNTCRRAIERLRKDGIVRKSPKTGDTAVDGLALMREKVVILKDGSWDDPSFFMIALHETAHFFEKNSPAAEDESKAVLAISAKLKNMGFSRNDVRRIFDVLWGIYGEYHAGAKVEEWAAADPLTERMRREYFGRRTWCIRTEISDDTPLKATIKAALEHLIARVEFVPAGMVKFDDPFKMFNLKDTYRDPGAFMTAFAAWLEVAEIYPRVY
jgi:hypothetical protein